MKHWKETGEIVSRVADLAAAGRRAAVATAIRISGSSYRRPGAKFLVEDEGGTMGGVSGGCLEADVRVVAQDVLRTGTPRLLHYETGSDDRTIWGLGLGCNGSVDIFVQSATEPPLSDTLVAVRALLERHEGSFAIATLVDAPEGIGGSMLVDPRGVIAGSTGGADVDRRILQQIDGLVAAGRSRADEIGGKLVFTDVLSVPPRLFVCGAGDDSRPLVAYAADVGFSVTVIDHRSDYLTRARFPSARQLLQLRAGDDISALRVDGRTLVVAKTHSFASDREWVRSFLQAGAPYVGLLGPRARREEILGQIGADAPQVFGPIGLDVGADGPEQVAVSIVGELLAFHSTRAGGHLREKTETIHAV